MSVYDDRISKMTPNKAREARNDFMEQLEFNCKRLVMVQNRKHKILKKLDKEIADIEEQISQIRNTIAEIDRCHFENNEYSDIDDAF